MSEALVATYINLYPVIFQISSATIHTRCLLDASGHLEVLWITVRRLQQLGLTQRMIEKEQEREVVLRGERLGW
jgi:hypothetical protein